MSAIELALLASRFVFDACALFLWGAAAFLGTLAPAVLRQPVWRQIGGLRRAALAGIALAVLCSLPLQAASLGDGWRDACNPQMLYRVATGTSIGAAWCMQVVVLVCVLGWRSMGACAFGSAALLGSLSLTGHAVMHDGWLRALHQLNQLLHLLSGGAWMGALVVVLTLLPRMKRAEEFASAKLALMRFSTVGHVVVLMVLLSGLANNFLILGAWPFALSQPYQRLLLCKAALVLLMAVIAIANRYIILPRLRASPLLRWSVWGEIALSAIVVLLAACIGMLAP
ncbi:copper homeostasis membrane protein CopD [Duganella aquatilis]|uniref:copper homeostasis membrane protein CopD n=1 Tax=Duganella aquatilis TaxID=2666082 RepID=UPI00140886E4|nr:copper homeostasis membrane protein CopD [Duganella aquatilis]